MPVCPSIVIDIVLHILYAKRSNYSMTMIHTGIDININIHSFIFYFHFSVADKETFLFILTVEILDTLR